MNFHPRTVWTVIRSKSRTFLSSVLVSCALLPNVYWIQSHKAEQLQPGEFSSLSSTLVYSILCRTVAGDQRWKSENLQLRREPLQAKEGRKSKYFQGCSRNWEEGTRSETIFFNMDIKYSSRSSFWKCLPFENTFVFKACEKHLRFFYWYWVSARKKLWTTVQHSWVWFLVLLLILDLSCDFSIFCLLNAGKGRDGRWW